MAKISGIAMMRTAIAMMLMSTGIAGAATPDGIERVRWLHGCWASVSGDRIIEEQWTAPRAGTMLEAGRTVRAATLVEYEFVVLRERGDRLAYLAHPSGQPAAEFLSITIEPDRVVFENQGHDFPQRVGYQRHGAQLDAWIEGSQDGKNRRADFHYQRAACEAQ
jgi:hypothetical protein